MQIEVAHRPSYAVGMVKLDAGESLKAESGAMVSMSSNVTIETKAQGGLLKGLKRSILGGESFFINTFTAADGPGEIMVAPSLPGDVSAHTLSGETLIVQSGSYLASSLDLEVETGWGGAKTFFSGEGLFMLKISGSGQLIISSYGAIQELELQAGQTYTVDTSHVVAFDATMGYEVKKIGGLKSTFFSGEGLVVQLTGPGKAYLQTRSPGAFLDWLIPLLPKQTSS